MSLGGLMGGIRSLFKGAPPVVRDPQTTPKKPFPEYPYAKPLADRIKWLIDRFYWESSYEKIQLHRKWFRNHLFSCLDGETKIHLLDNRDVALKELATTEKLPVWSY